MASIKMTSSTQLVLRALLESPTRALYGLEICAATGLKSGTVHPILARLKRLQWAEATWENIDPTEESRPRRRYYRLNRYGTEQAREALAKTRMVVPSKRKSYQESSGDMHNQPKPSIALRVAIIDNPDLTRELAARLLSYVWDDTGPRRAAHSSLTAACTIAGLFLGCPGNAVRLMVMDAVRATGPRSADPEADARAVALLLREFAVYLGWTDR